MNQNELHQLDELERMVITDSLFCEIKNYCQATPEHEVCGLIGGRGELACSFYPVKNVAEDPKHQYYMDAAEQITAFKTQRERREQLLGIVHSHPDSAAEPSPTDLALASYPGVVYLIISLVASEANGRAYLFQEQSFQEIPLDIVT